MTPGPPPPVPRESRSPRKREAEYFDRHIQARGDFNPFAPRGWRTLTRRFEELAAPPAAADILDVGCGAGQSRQIYRARAARFVGLDLSAHAIALARRRFPQDLWHVADACRLPFPDGCFDVVAFSSVLHHIDTFPQAVAEAYRVLKPGGVVFAFDPNLLHPAMALLRWPRSPFYLSEGVSPNESPMLARRLRAAFVAAGFAPVRQHCQADIPYRAVAPRLINACLWLYNAGDWLLDRLGLGRWFGTFIITAARKPETPL